MKKMMIVDGYNVIHQSDRYKSRARDLEEARLKLIEDMVSYGAMSNLEVVIIFDGSGAWADTGKVKSQLGVKVIFTKRGQTADSMIEKLAHSPLPGKEVIVVTADYEEQRAIFAKGALRKTPRELIDEISGQLADHTPENQPRTRRIFIEDSLDEQTRDKLRKLR